MKINTFFSVLALYSIMNICATQAQTSDPYIEFLYDAFGNIEKLVVIRH